MSMTVEPMPAAAIGVLTVYERAGPAEGDETAVGRVGLGADGRMVLLEALPERYQWLHGLTDRMNRKPAIVRLVPPSGDAPQSAIMTEVIGRDSGQFLEALSEHLRKYFRLRLG
jgi:hypothetical protein